MQFYVREAPAFSRVRQFWRRILAKEKKNNEDINNI
jgi:hypothetical protein